MRFAATASVDLTGAGPAGTEAAAGVRVRTRGGDGVDVPEGRGPISLLTTLHTRRWSGYTDGQRTRAQPALHRSFRTAPQLPPPMSSSTPDFSIVRCSPSRSETSGVHPKSS